MNRRLRSLLIALTALAISATVALAAKPSTIPNAVSSDGPAATARPEASEITDQADESEAPEIDAPDASESPEASDEVDEGAATNASEPDGDSAVGSDNHGKLVSEAAKLETPEGYANHGAWVRLVARANHGHADKAPKSTKPSKPPKD